jgi:hypothetical protein
MSGSPTRLFQSPVIGFLGCRGLGKPGKVGNDAHEAADGVIHDRDHLARLVKRPHALKAVE